MKPLLEGGTVKIPLDIENQLRQELEKYIAIHTYYYYWKEVAKLAYFNYDYYIYHNYALYHPRRKSDVLQNNKTGWAKNEYQPTRECWERYIKPFALEFDRAFVKYFPKIIKMIDGRVSLKFLQTVSLDFIDDELMKYEKSVHIYTVDLDKYFPVITKVKDNKLKQINIELIIQDPSAPGALKRIVNGKDTTPSLGGWASTTSKDKESVISPLIINISPKKLEKVVDINYNNVCSEDEYRFYKFNERGINFSLMKTNYVQLVHDEFGTLAHELTHIFQVDKFGTTKGLTSGDYNAMDVDSPEYLKAHTLDTHEYKANIQSIVHSYLDMGFNDIGDFENFIEYNYLMKVYKENNIKLWKRAVRDIVNTLNKEYGIKITKDSYDINGF